MKAGQTTLKPLIQGDKQYRVPLFQRPYVWERAQLRQLWDDMLVQYQDLLPAEVQAADRPHRSTHFLGSFVLAPVPAPQAHGVSAWLVVDGQQRLATILLAIAALRDVHATTDPQAHDRYNHRYLINEFVDGPESYKLLPARDDREAFFACIDGRTVDGAAVPGRILDAYRFFHLQLSRPLPDGTALDLALIEHVIVERLAIVDITVEPDDNPHRIFESLNATGVGLTQGDLLRNYLFMLLPTTGSRIYERVWAPMERELGPENLEGLARVDLLRRGQDAARDDVYRLQRERIEPFASDEGKVESVVRDLALRAKHYGCLLEPLREPDTRISVRLAWLKRWGAQTTYPLLMHIYDLVETGRATRDDMVEALSFIESFIVRRHVAQVPTNQLNRLFTDMIKQLAPGVPVAQAIREALSGPRRYWATDDQLREACRTKWFYISGRADQRRMILERLEQSYEDPEPVDLTKAKLTIEHILPQTLDDAWREQLREQAEDPDSLRDELLHTLGNLTLTAYNGQLSNSLFERKQQIYHDSHLRLNRGLIEATAWGRAQILARADELADQAIKIWPGPVPGAKGIPVAGFDWSRVDAVVSAIPPGRWTSYGELAQLAGTSAQPVGNRMSSSNLPTAYRVLDRFGRISESFRWPDPGDHREPAALLASEGIRFDDQGLADPEQRLSAYELACLIPVEFDPEELERLRALAAPDSPAWSGEEKWRTDGRLWHLEHRATAKTRPMLEALVAILAEVIPDTPPRWNQKYYVAWPLRGRNWLRVHPMASRVIVEVSRAPGHAGAAAEQLGYQLVAAGERPSGAADGPAMAQQGTDGDLWLTFRRLIDVQGPARDRLVEFLGEARDFFLETQPVGSAEAEPWIVDGRSWHLDQRCSAKTRSILEALVAIVGTAVPEADGPRWGQKHYVAWEFGGHRRWVRISTWPSWLMFRLRTTQPAAEVADRLGLAFVPEGTTPSWASNGPSLVQRVKEGVRVMFRAPIEVGGSVATGLPEALRRSLASEAGVTFDEAAEEDDDEFEAEVTEEAEEAVE
jgi:alkylated DNA nucleotide flippase Atl1